MSNWIVTIYEVKKFTDSNDFYDNELLTADFKSSEDAEIFAEMIINNTKSKIKAVINCVMESEGK